MDRDTASKKSVRRLGIWVIPVLIATLFGMGACGSGSGEALFAVTTYDNAVSGEAASVEGLLVKVGECLAIGMSDGAVIPSFPKKQVSFTKEGVKLFGKTYALADTVSFTGAYIELTDDIVIPEACKQPAAITKLFQVSS